MEGGAGGERGSASAGNAHCVSRMAARGAFRLFFAVVGQRVVDQLGDQLAVELVAKLQPAHRAVPHEVQLGC